MENKTVKTQKTKESAATRGGWLWGALAFCLLLLIDLLTKIVAEVYFDVLGNKNVTLIDRVIYFTYSENPGVAFSGAADAPPAVKIGIVVGTAIVMLGASILYFAMDSRRTFVRWCLIFIVAGGVGNLIDRVLFRMWAEDGGGVRDMVRLDFSVLIEDWFHIPPTNFLDFGVCNFADFFIVGGAVALFFGFLFFDTDAVFPVGKYKQLAREAEEKEQAKLAAKTNDGR